MSKKFLNFLIFFLLAPIFLFGNFFNSVFSAQADANKTIVITFSGTPTSVTASVTPLKYDKNFAYSFYFDDGPGSYYDPGFAYLNGGWSNFFNTNFGGLYYTDGTGNNVPFHMSLANFSRNSTQLSTSSAPAYSDLHTGSLLLPAYIHWGDMQTTVDYGWDVLNHGWTSASEDYTGQLFYGGTSGHVTSTLDYAFEISQENVEVGSHIVLKNNAGATTTVFQQIGFVMPNGDQNYHQPFMDSGLKFSFINGTTTVPYVAMDSNAYRIVDLNNQANVDLINVAPVVFPNRYFMSGNFTDSALFSAVDTLAASSTGSSKFWLNPFTHYISTTSMVTGGMSWTNFKGLMDHIETSYGRFGNDTAWVAGGEEVYDYQIVKKNTVVSQSLVGNQLTLTFDTSQVPAGLRHYALSLMVNSNTSIDSISYGSGFVYHSDNKNTGLINVDWGDNAYTKNDVTRVNDLVGAAEASRLQVDVDNASIYNNMLQDPTKRAQFQNRLSSVTVLGDKWLIHLMNLSNTNTRTYNGGTDNWNEFAPRSNLSLTSLKDVSGIVTPLSISVSTTTFGFFNSVATTSATLYPASTTAQGISVSTTSASRTVRLNNLTTSTNYTITLYSSHIESPVYSRKWIGDYTINGTTKTFDSHQNLTGSMVFANVIPNASGQIDITIAPRTASSSSEADINVIQIDEQLNKKATIAINSLSQPNANKAVVNYSISDPESDSNDLASYQYSLTDSWSGEEATATPLISDGLHEGVHGLSSSVGGASHNFVWNIANDLPVGFYGNVYFRLVPSEAVAGNGYAGLSGAFLVDLRNPAVSNLIASTTSPTAVSINWTTNRNGSSQLAYGLGPWYGNLTAVSDQSSMTTNHSQGISGLPSCSAIYYQAISLDSFGQQATSTGQSFVTSGCLGGAAINSYSTNLVPASSGGTSTLASTLGQQISLVATAGYAATDASIQIKELATSSVLAVAPINGRHLVGSVYDFSAYTSLNNQINNFNNNLNLTFSYQDSDVLGINPASLKIRYWDATSSDWQALSGCTVDQVNKKVTCQTNHFSDYALFGDSDSAPVFTFLSTRQLNYKIDVNYSLVDQEGDNADLGTYQYSTTGLWVGEEATMTPLLSDPIHSGITDLTASSSPIGHTFVWDFLHDLSASFRGIVYLRFQPKGSINPLVGNAATSSMSIAVVPEAPTNISALRGDTQATISFSSPIDDGGSTVNDYLVVSSPGGFMVSGSSSPIIISGLTNGTSYTFSVRAMNIAGYSAYSASSSPVTPITIPTVVTDYATGTTPGFSRVFGTIVDTGGENITQIGVDYNNPEIGSGSFSTGGNFPAGQRSIQGAFTCGYTYDVTFWARNSVGKGYGNTISFTSICPPSVITGSASSITPNSAILGASISLINGGTAGQRGFQYGTSTSYGLDVTESGSYNEGSYSKTISSLSCNTTYHFRSFAVNNSGSGYGDDATFKTAACVPNPPTNIMATSGDSSAQIYFTAPADDGGSAITFYTITSSPDGLSTTTATTSGLIVGLTNGVSYTFSVSASNVYGSSGASASSSPVVPSTIPGAPTAVAAVRGNSQATISFLAPFSDGGSPIISYTAVSSPGSFSASASSSPIVVSGLTNGTGYTFVVKAHNVNGDSSLSSPSSSVTPAAVPSAPLNLLASPGSDRVSLSWDTPSNNGGSAIANYKIEYKQSSSGSWSIFSLVSATSSTVTVDNLLNDSTYDFRVSAVNSAGTGPASNVISDLHLLGLPSSPLSLGATRGNGQASLSWSEPASDGGSAIINYFIEHKLSSDSSWSGTLSGSGTSAIVGSLNNGSSYDFRVSAVSAIGTSSPSSIASMTPGNVPDAPINVSATRGNSQATISFSAPMNNGGFPITSYQVNSSLGSFGASSSSSPITISGLSNGTPYTFVVRATNLIGHSVASQNSNEIVPATIPVAPSNLGVQVSDSVFNLSWQGPDDNGGAPVTAYQVEYHVQFSYPYSDYLWLPLATTSSSSLAVSGLTSGISYAFRVRAINSVGTGAASNSATATLGGAVFSSIGIVASSSSVHLSWDTGSLSTTEVNFGLDSSYGLGSIMKDTDPLVSHHEETLQNLIPCTTYHYQLSAFDSLGNNSVSSDNTFSTTGCFGDAVPSASLNFNVQISTSVNETFDWPTGRSTSLIFPAASAGSDFRAQLSRLPSSQAIIAHPAPNGYTVIGDVFQLNTYQGNVSLNSFLQPVNLKLFYQDQELNHVDELSIAVFFWDGNSWQKSSCVLDAVTNSVSCDIDQPGIFVLFGQNYQASSISFDSFTQNATSSVSIDYSTFNSSYEPTNLGAYEFSSTGVFNGERRAMTPLTGAPGHSGISNLDSSPTGMYHRFIWNSNVDLGANFAGTMYFRFTPYDNLAGTGTPIIASTTLDFRAPGLSLVSVASITPQSAIINWTTDELASTQLEYGLTMNYGNLTVEKDISSRLLIHSESLNNLVSCARYYYRVRSKDIFGNEYLGSTRSVMTSGCLGGAAITSTGQNTVSNSSGGSASLSGQLSVSLPSSFASSTVDLQLNQLDGNAVLNAAPIGTNKRLVPDKVFDIKAFSDISNIISVLSESGLIQMTYTNNDILNINEDSLQIYYWNAASSTWSVLNNCVRDKSLKKVTCDAPHFSVFALLGDYVPTVTPPASGGGGGGGGSSYFAVDRSILRTPSSGQFKFLINNGATSTLSNTVNITLDGGLDTSLYLISENPDFAGAVLRSYATTGNFILSSGIGLKKVYLKFANSYGYFSKVISADINLLSEGLTITQDPESFFVSGGEDELATVINAKLELINSTLSPGNNNGEVIKLQNFLIYSDLLARDANTGKYGAQTRAAVEKFQVKYKIIAPGVYGYGLFGKATKNKVNSLIAAINKKLETSANVLPTKPIVKAAMFKFILAPGIKGAEVRKLQDFLISQGLLAKTSNNSYYGVSTKAAVAKFQINKGILKNSKQQGYGIFGPTTMQVANQILTK